jgi:hypothetical protein
MTTCPVCGKGEYKLVEMEQEEDRILMGKVAVSHLACVEKLEAANEKWHERFQTALVGGKKEIEARQQAEAERDELRKAMRTPWQEEARSYCQNANYHRQKREQAEAELEAQKCCGNCDHLYCDCGQHECHESDGNPFPVSLGSSCVLPTSQWTARVEEGSKYCEEDIANSDRPLG